MLHPRKRAVLARPLKVLCHPLVIGGRTMNSLTLFGWNATQIAYRKKILVLTLLTFAALC